MLNSALAPGTANEFGKPSVTLARSYVQGHYNHLLISALYVLFLRIFTAKATPLKLCLLSCQLLVTLINVSTFQIQRQLLWSVN